MGILHFLERIASVDADVLDRLARNRIRLEELRATLRQIKDDQRRKSVGYDRRPASERYTAENALLCFINDSEVRDLFDAIVKEAVEQREFEEIERALAPSPASTTTPAADRNGDTDGRRTIDDRRARTR